MAITVSGPTIIFDDTSVAQASLYNETFGTGVFPEGGTSLTISGGTAFKSSVTGGAGHIATVVGVKTDASVILETPQSGSVTVNPIVSGVYVFAIGGGGGGAGTSPLARTVGSNGTPSFFSTVIGNSGTGGSPGGGTGGGTGGTATGGTTNTSGTTAASRPGTGNGGNAGGFPGVVSGAGGAGAGPGSPGATPFPGPGLAGEPAGGGGGGSWTVLTGGAGGGGGGLAIHSRLTITGGSPYPYQVGAPGAGGVGPSATGGAGGRGYLKFVLYD
jgi:hypothetical protein